MILNQVTGGMPSQPNQIVKIAGQPAEMACAYANETPYWGYRLLNSNRIVLTTGTPILGADGGIEALCVTDGQLTIRYGMKLEPFEQLDLIACTIKIEGEVQANKIQLLSGATRVNYTKAGIWTAAYQAGPQPLEQQNRPSQDQLTLTEQAKVCAGSNLAISSSGRLLNQGVLKAEGNLSLEAKELENQASALIDGKFLTLTLHEQLKNGGVIQGSAAVIRTQNLINNGELTVDGTLTTEHQAEQPAGRLTHATPSTVDSRNKLSIQADNLTNQNGRIIARADFVLKSTVFQNMGGRIEVKGDQSVLDIQAGTIFNFSGWLLHTGAGQTQIVADRAIMNFNLEAVKGAGLIFGKGPVTITSPQIMNDNGGTILSQQVLKIKVTTFLFNKSSTLSARLKIEIDAGALNNIKGRITVGEDEASKAATSRGAHGLLHLTPRVSLLEVRAEQVTNIADEGEAQGSLIRVQGRIVMEAQKIYNGNKSQILGKGVNLNAKELFSNSDSTVSAGDTLSLTADSLVNSAKGVLQSDGDISLKGKALENQANALIDGRFLTLTPHDQLENGGVIQGSTVVIDTQSLVNDGIDDTDEHQAGVIMARHQLTIGAHTLDNREHGLVHSDGELTIGGPLSAQYKVAGSAHRLTNAASSTIDSREKLSIQADHLDNQSGRITTSSDLVLKSKEFNNQSGHIETKGEQSLLDLQADIIWNASGRLLHTGAGQTQIVAHAIMANLNIDGTKGAGLIFGKGPVTIISPKISNVDDGRILSNQTLKIKAASLLLNRSGTLSASQKIEIIDTGTLNNRAGLIVVGTNEALKAEGSTYTPSPQESRLEIHAKQVINEDAGQIIQIGAGEIKIDADVIIDNDSAPQNDETQGSLISAQGNLMIEARDINNKGTLQSDGKIHISTDFFNNSGTLHSRGEIFIEGTRITNNNQPYSNEILNGFFKIFQGLQTSDVFKQTAALITGNTILIGTHERHQRGAFLTNMGGTIFAQNGLEIGAKNVENVKQGVLYSGGSLTIGGELDAQFKVTGISEKVFNYGSTIDALGDLAIHAKELNNQNSRFETRDEFIERREIQECQDHNAPHRYDGSQLVWEDGCGGGYHVQHSGETIYHFTYYKYTRLVRGTVVTHSQPGKIQAGGAIRLSGQVTNDKSRIIAGGTLSDFEGASAQIDNRDAKAWRHTTDQGTVQYSDRHWNGGFTREFRREWRAPALYQPPSHIEEHNLNIAIVAGGQQYTAVAYQEPSMSAVLSTSTLTSASPFLNSGLQQLLLDPDQAYLIQTDPRFTRNSDTLSSNFLLNLLNLDPQHVPKRLGDGFYEQQLIRDQIIGLTGHYYLSGYRNPAAEFKALMHRGANWAKQQHLTLGMEPTPQQLAALSASPIWLVNQRVKLPNGSEQTVLMPKVYLAKNDASPVLLSGSLISANAIDLQSESPFKNAGTVISRGKVNLSARNIDNQRGAIVSSDSLSMAVSDDIDSRAGTLIAVKKIRLKAGRDIHLQSQTQTTHADSGSRTTLDGVTQVSAEQLDAYAESDINLAAAEIKVDKNATLEAKNDLTLGTVTTGLQQQLIWDERNGLSLSRKTDVGTLMQTGGTLELKAGHDLHAVGAHVNAGEALAVKAGHDINLGAAYEEVDFAASHYYESSNSFSSSSELTQNKSYRKQALSSTFSGGTVRMEAGHDLSVTGSNIVGMHNVNLHADNDIKLEAAQQIEKASHYSVKERSGLLDSGSFGLTIGERQQKDQFEGENTPYIGTVIGSVSGHIQVTAGREYQQSGSQLVAPEGNIDGKALTGNVVPVHEHDRRWQHSEWHQSGLTVSVSAPVIAAAQTSQQMLEASTQVSDPRMQALAAGVGGLTLTNAYDAIQADPKAAGGVTVSAMIGESHQESQQTQLSATALGSAIKAGGSVRMDMKGLGEKSTLNITGSQIEAAQDVELNVEGQLNIEAAPNTFVQHSEQHSQSSAFGMAATFGAHSSMGASVAFSSGRGHADGAEVIHTAAQIKAGGKLLLNAQSDVHLKGAQLSGQQIEANIEGDLEIESVQNANTYSSHHHSISGSATVGPVSAVSINFSQQKLNSDYLSVAEQAGIQAGDGGFQIKVKGDTKLVGGVIESTDRAIEEGKNQLVTATLAVESSALRCPKPERRHRV